MIEKMKFLSITGPKDDIDRVAQEYLLKYEIHLENALSELSQMKGLRPFIDNNPYKSVQVKAEEIAKYISSNCSKANREMVPDEAVAIIEEADRILGKYQEEKVILEEENKRLKDILNSLEPFRMLPFSISTIANFKFIKCRYGKMPKENFNKFRDYENDNLNVFFQQGDFNEDYVWGVYFTTNEEADKIDAIFTSLHFERMRLPDRFEGNHEEAYQKCEARLKANTQQLNDLKKEFENKLNKNGSDILKAIELVDIAIENNSIRHLAACTKDIGIVSNHEHESFYILCGWMAKKDAESFLKDIENDPNVFCISEEDQDTLSKPPTKLKNPNIFKPFEMFVSMYGLPAYNEIDPTAFLAITYSLLFGIMFGDVGQGLVLMIGGFLLYKIKKMSLAAIIALAGVFSTIFGFMYGSIFGFEGVYIHPIWISPMEEVMTILYITIAFGAFLNVVAMSINIINAIRNKKKSILFGTNGVAGFVFYVTLLVCVVAFLLGNDLPPTWILVLCLVIPLICIFLQEPLSRWIEGKRTLIHGSKGMFFVEAFFELFEIMLSFLSNTISFVRVGAFALSHAGMMGVVLMLAGAEEGLTEFSVSKIVILIIGNIFVMALEGLTVGIQVLRLEYYEMFSRFYKGTGKKFVPFSRKVRN